MTTYETEVTVRLESGESIPTLDFKMNVIEDGNTVLELEPENGALSLFGQLPDSKEGSCGIISWDEKFVKIFLHNSGDGNGHSAILKFPFDESFLSVMKLWKLLYDLYHQPEIQEQKT